MIEPMTIGDFLAGCGRVFVLALELIGDAMLAIPAIYFAYFFGALIAIQTALWIAFDLIEKYWRFVRWMRDLP